MAPAYIIVDMLISDMEQYKQYMAAAPAAVAPPLVEKDLLRATPGGLTADEVGKRAAETSYGVKASQDSLRAAAGRVDAAWANFLPRLTAKASYTRLSSFTPPSLGSGGSLVATPSPTSRVYDIDFDALRAAISQSRILLFWFGSFVLVLVVLCFA